MTRAWRRFAEAYLSLDRRVLGVFRIVYGLVLFHDLARRFEVLDFFFSNDGVLSNHYVLFRPQHEFQLSLLTAFSTPSEVRLAFGLIALVYAAYTLGLGTRLAQVLALVSLTSLNSRNLFAEDGGVSTLIVLGVWTLLLPVGDRFSIDALRREASLGTVRARVRERCRRLTPVVSLAVLALALQVLAIYWLNALHKSGATWRGGEAVHYVLWQSRVVTDFGAWLARNEPSWLSPVATYGTLVIEWVLPVLALSPFGVWPRVLAFCLALALHGGIAVLMTLGPFSYAMLALVLLRVPWPAFAAVGRRVPWRWRRALMRARAQAVRWLRARRFSAARLKVTRARSLWTPAREAVVGLLMLAALADMSAYNRAFPFKLPQPRWLRSITGYPRFFERWNMFSPNAPREDGAGVIDAVTVSGKHVDPITGVPPRFDVLEHGPLPHGSIPADYLFVMHFPENKAYIPELARYVREWHLHEGRTPNDRIVRFELWWLSRASPPPGSTTAGPVQRELVTRGP